MAEKCFEGDGLHGGLSCMRVQLKGYSYTGVSVIQGFSYKGVQLHGG